MFLLLIHTNYFTSSLLTSLQAGLSPEHKTMLIFLSLFSSSAFVIGAVLLWQKVKLRYECRHIFFCFPCFMLSLYTNDWATRTAYYCDRILENICCDCSSSKLPPSRLNQYLWGSKPSPWMFISSSFGLFFLHRVSGASCDWAVGVSQENQPQRRRAGLSQGGP